MTIDIRDASRAWTLEALGVVAGYGGRTILHQLDLRIRAGEIYALLGANGAGKTTALSLFLGFVAPTAGQVRVHGVDPVAQPGEARRHLAYIPENVALYEHLTARENVAYLLDLAGQNPAPDAIARALAAAGLQAQAFDRRVGGFSKGMRQKVAIALALARQV
ncbi:MAG: ATP-binding cassette domain-containing protein, partial [Comamonas sp.]